MGILSQLNKGQKATVINIGGDEKLARRLKALGCNEGTEVTVVNRAPMGDPMVIGFRGFSLAIRQKDAVNIAVEI